MSAPLDLDLWEDLWKQPDTKTMIEVDTNWEIENWNTSGNWSGWCMRSLHPRLEAPAEVKTSLCSSSLPPPTPTQSWRAGSSSTENISSPDLPIVFAETWLRKDKVEHFFELFSPHYHWPLLFLWLSPSHLHSPRGMHRHLIHLIKILYWRNLQLLGQLWTRFGNLQKFNFSPSM